MSLNKTLNKILVSNKSTDIRSKIKSLIGSDVPSIIQAWANFKGYDALHGKNIVSLLLYDKILDDDFQKFLTSLQNIKATSNRLSKKDFISLFKTLINDAGMDSVSPYVEEIINYLGYAIYLVIFSGLDLKVFNFMLLKAKYQDSTYKDPQNSQDPSKDVKEILCSAHIKFKALRVKRRVIKMAHIVSEDAFGRFPPTIEYTYE